MTELKSWGDVSGEAQEPKRKRLCSLEEQQAGTKSAAAGPARPVTNKSDVAGQEIIQK
jgi:hypothetical protein